MNEQFDKELRNHIRDTFGQYDDQMADDGWRKFNANKKKKRRGLIFWYAIPSGLAAALALFLLLNIYDSQPEIASEKSLTKKSIQQLDKEKETQLTTIDGNKIEESLEKPKKEIALNSSEKTEILNRDEKKDRVSTNQNNTVTKNTLALNPTKTLPQIEEVEFVERNQEIVEFANSAETLPVESNENSLISLSNLPDNQILAQSGSIGVKPKENDKAEYTDDQYDADGLLAKQPLLKQAEKTTLVSALAKNTTRKNAVKGKRFKLGIDANTYVNFTENGVNDQINLGIGLVSELKITNQLSINSGISINRQTSTFEGTKKYSTDFKQASFSAIAAVPSAQTTDAKLVGLDIPLNLKFAMKMGKTNTFISTGFSAYSVINEKYVNDFSVVNYSFTGVKTSNVVSVLDNPAGQFSYFKFARTLNFSFGVLYPLSKKNSISVEPFMKYPLSGLGYQDLKIGSGGLSFKLNLGK
ncbi:outer membrane beta-barrel protein [Pedobacter cryophilus]|uniref:PorT family protein n=1 Tax=Pedobacter cryophilus TaxID=2571271 RepID=A0A4U1C0Y2_9SPHI|nr:outer membrane beta-barrel protein [Pedobacter cryophilus]TKB98695.1 PorT family protein [Pedobacter cryophilus]